MKTILFWCCAWCCTLAVATEYPATTTLQLLDERLTLPENVERLKRAGMPRAEISLVLAHALPWWDAGSPDTTNLSAAKAEAVTALEAERRSTRRSWWRDRLMGRITAKEADARRVAADADFAVRLGAALTADEKAEYLFRASPGMAKVREWTWGLGVDDEKLLWLADGERQWTDCVAKARAAAEQRVPLMADFDAARLARMRTALMVLDVATAATFVRRADSDFDYWCVVLGDAAVLAPEKLLRVYVVFCDLRRAKLELLADRSITKTQENEAVSQLRATARAAVAAALGDDGFRRFAAHELGVWLRESAAPR